MQLLDIEELIFATFCWFLENLPLENPHPENSHPSNSHLVNCLCKIPIEKFPPGIFPHISLIRRYSRGSVSHLTLPFIQKWGKGVYTPSPW